MMISSSSPRPDEQVLRHGAQISDAAPTHVGRPTRDTRPTAQSQGWRLVAALHKLTEDDVQLNRMPGSGLHRQAELTWHGRNVAVNTSQTGCVHTQGKGAGSLAQSLSPGARRCAPAVSPDVSNPDTVATPPHDQDSTSDSHISQPSHGQRLVVCLPHVVSACSLFTSSVTRLFSEVRLPHTPLRFLPLVMSFLLLSLSRFSGTCSHFTKGRSHTQRKRIRRAGSQTASRRGARQVPQDNVRPLGRLVRSAPVSVLLPKGGDPRCARRR